MPELYYRYNDYTTGYGASLWCKEYLVIRRTEASILLREKFGSWYGPDKWIRKRARNVFAAPNKAEALYHFIKRKDRQIRIVAHNLEKVREARIEAQRQWEEKICENTIDEAHT